MRIKLSLLAIFTLIYSISFAQTHKTTRQVGSRYNMVFIPGILRVDSAILFPIDTTIRLHSYDRAISTVNGIWYGWNGTSWQSIMASGGVGTTSHPITFDTTGTGAPSGTVFDGSVAKTISYNTVGSLSSKFRDSIFYSEPIEYDSVHKTLKINSDSLNARIGLASGAYTPTLTSTTNLAAISVLDAVYSRIGQVVHISLEIQYTATTAHSQSSFVFSLPAGIVSKNIGTGVVTAASSTVSIHDFTTSNTVSVTFVPATTSADIATIQYDYLTN